jgi:hypothetical protein
MKERNIMSKPTKSDYLNYAGYSPRHYLVEICDCDYDENGMILNFATDTWECVDNTLEFVPVDTPLQLNIIKRHNGDKMEDIGISINGETGEIESSAKHFNN